MAGFIPASEGPFENVVRGFSLVPHDPEGSHYKNLDSGGYKTRPYVDDTRAPMHPLAPREIVIRFLGLLAIGGKTWFLLVFLALEFLSR